MLPFLARRWLGLLIFFLFLLYYVLGTGWLESSRLVLQVQSSAKQPLIQVRWDGGQGWNTYEQRLFRPHLPSGELHITLGATDRRNPASLSKQVICTAILVDGKELDLRSLSKDETRFQHGGLYFRDHEQLSFTVQAERQLGFRFRTDTASGKVFVGINDFSVEYDLYMANVEAHTLPLEYWLVQSDGSFTLALDLPRYPVRALEISSPQPSQLLQAQVQGKGQVRDLLAGQPVALGTFQVSEPLRGLRSFLHPLHFGQQFFFALLSTWLLTALIQHLHRAEARAHLASRRLLWFYLPLVTSLVVFGAWLAAFWPGVMSVDSMKVWRAALLPDLYLNDHPFLNVLLYKYLAHWWSNPAVVPLVQGIALSVLLAWFSLYLRQLQVPGPWILCWLLWVWTSVPLGLYTVVLWKDIPFALILILWACLLVKFWHEKQQGWSVQGLLALLLLGLVPGLIRHNGLVYLIVLPSFFILLGLVPRKKVLLMLGFVGLLSALALLGLHSNRHQAGTAFLSQELHKYTAQLRSKDLVQESKRTMQDYMRVLNINQTQQKWDKFHYYTEDRYAWSFLRHSGWWDVYPYQKQDLAFPRLNHLAQQLYKSSYAEPWVYLWWNPVPLLLLVPIVTFLFVYFPNAAILGGMLLAGALPLIYLQIFNWRYYYFLYMGLLFLPAFLGLDLFSPRQSKR
jgi:hypothetical protein